MLVCLPTNGNAGVEDTVCDHFGSAPYFTLYNTDSEGVIVLSNQNAHHSHGSCHPLQQLTAYQLDCVVCNGIGRRAVGMLNRAGIRVLSPGVARVRDVLTRIKAGELQEVDPRTACGGHGHGGLVHGPCHEADGATGGTATPPRPQP